MGYDRGDSFPFDFESNGIPFGSENRKGTCHHDHIPFNVKANGNLVFSVRAKIVGIVGTIGIAFFFVIERPIGVPLWGRGPYGAKLRFSIKPSKAYCRDIRRIPKIYSS